MFQLVKIKLYAHSREIVLLAIISLFALPLGVSYAENVPGRPATMADIAFFMNSHADLPEYCQCRLAEAEFRGKKWPAQFGKVHDKWVKRFGASWGYLHHYCFGIRNLNQAMSVTDSSKEAQRKKTLTKALGEFKYVEDGGEGSSKGLSFPLWHQLFMYEYQIYMQLGQPVMAQKALEQAAKYQKGPNSNK